MQALRIDPQNTEAHYNLGLVRMKWGDLEAASSSFREVLRLNPAHGAAQLRLASILTQLARNDQKYIPPAVAAYARAAFQGHFARPAASNDVWRMMPGSFAINEQGIVRAVHYARHAGDQPDLGRMLAALRQE